MRRKVYLYGKLANEFGPEFELEANSIGDVVRLLEANYPNKFMRIVRDGQYRVTAGKTIDNGVHFDNDTLKLNLGSKDLHIMPVPEGSGGNGFFKIVLGVALIAAAFAFAPAVVGALGPTQGLGTAAFSIGSFSVSYGSIALFGASLVLQGISALLTPTPSTGDYSQREQADERPSFLFNGPVNTVEQGGVVPVIYGRSMTGSVLISAGINAEQI